MDEGGCFDEMTKWTDCVCMAENKGKEGRKSLEVEKIKVVEESRGYKMDNNETEKYRRNGD
jgi:hypothetical protein